MQVTLEYARILFIMLKRHGFFLIDVYSFTKILSVDNNFCGLNVKQYKKIYINKHTEL